MQLKLNRYNREILIGVPVFFPSLPYFQGEQLQKHKACVLSLMSGTSFSTAYKDVKKFESKRKISQEEQTILDAKEHCNKILDSIIKKIYSIKPLQTLKHDLMSNALIRLQASYEACIFLATEGFNFETKTLCRLILENLNFIFQVSNFDCDNIENIFEFFKKHKIQITNITSLKKYYSHVNLGKLYGKLTEYSHFNENIQHTMFKLDEEYASIYLKAPGYSKENFHCLIQLLELNQVIIEYSFRDILKSFTFIDKKTFYVKENKKKTRYRKIEDLNSIINTKEPVFN